MPTLLAIGAHYDDCVFGIPGILLQAVRKHYRAVMVAMIGDYSSWRSLGEAGSARLVRDSRDLAAGYGAEMRYLSYASMGFGMDAEAKRAVSEIAAEVKPDVALMLWPRDTHPDHEAASGLSKVALRWAGAVLKSPDFRPPKQIYQFDNGPRHTIDFRPDTYVDVTDEWPKAIEWLGRLMALVDGRPYDPAKQHPAQQAKEALCRYRGSACGVRYAEALKGLVEYPRLIL